MPQFIEAKGNLDFYASDVIGETVYNTENDVSGEMTVNSDALGDWDVIGEVDDILIDTDGKVLAAIVGVGGFLGMGEKDVAIDMSTFKYVRDEDDADTYYLVLNSTEDQLTGAPAFEREMTEMDEDHAAMNEGNVTEMGEDHAAMDQNDATMEHEYRKDRTAIAPPQVEREGYRMTSIDELRSETLQGAEVYGINDENIGEIGDLIITADGKIDHAIIDVGGFLGLGEKEVALGFDEMTILQSEDGDVVRVYVDTSEEALENMPEYTRS